MKTILGIIGLAAIILFIGTAVAKTLKWMFDDEYHASHTWEWWR